MGGGGKGWWGEGGLALAHSLLGCRSSSGKPQAAPPRPLLPEHNVVTNGAMKILQVERPSLLLSKPAELLGEGWGGSNLFVLQIDLMLKINK